MLALITVSINEIAATITRADFIILRKHSLNILDKYFHKIF